MVDRRDSGLLRDGKYCGQPVRLELFEHIKILNPALDLKQSRLLIKIASFIKSN
jgi:hypothetical protein